MNAKFLVTIPRRSCSRKNSTESTQPDDRRSGISPFGLRPLSAIPLHSAISIAAAMEKGSNQPPISGTKKAVPKYDLFHSGGEEGIQDPSTTRGVVISIAAAMEKGSNQPPISGTKKAATSATLFVMAERKGFEPLWLAPNGFQDRLVMTASIPLRGDCNTLYFSTEKARCQANSFRRQNCTECLRKG